MDTTTIRLKRKTKDRLKAFKVGGQTFDHLINELLDEASRDG